MDKMADPSLVETAARAPAVLLPYDKREAVTLRRAAEIAGRCESTMRTWCDRYCLARRIADGPRSVSQVALAMLLNGDMKTLADYHNGARARSEPVGWYYRRLGLGDLLKLPAFQV